MNPRELWPDLAGWDEVGMGEAVYRVQLSAGAVAFVRPDDGSSRLLGRLAADGVVPVPRVLEVRDDWLLLDAVRGESLHEETWLRRPAEAASIVADALRRLETAGVTHGDMCLPNILGDPDTGRLAGIIDWRFAGRYDREIDVASAIWSCAFNGYEADVAFAVLDEIDWPKVDADEVARLSLVWSTLVEQEEPS